MTPTKKIMSVKIDAAWDNLMLRKICLDGGITADLVYKAAWALTAARFFGNNEVSFGVVSTDSPFKISKYFCEIDPAGPVMEVVKQLQNGIQYYPVVEIPVNLSDEIRKEDANMELMLSVSQTTMPDTVSKLWINLPKYVDIKLHALIQECDSAITLEYSTPISSFLANNLARCLGTTIFRLTMNLTMKVADVNMLRDEDIRTIIDTNCKVLEPVDQCVHELIHQQAEAQPNELAIYSWDGSLTYSTFDGLSSRLAKKLCGMGVRRGMIIPFCFNKSMWAVVAITAILKAGGAAVALAPKWPTEKAMGVIQATKASLILTGPGVGHLNDIERVQVLSVDAALMNSLRFDQVVSVSDITPHDIAFIQFTSGTTGTPKGIILEHRAFSTSAVAQSKSMDINRFSRVFQFAAYTFDASLQEMFTTLIAGGCICIPSEEDRLNCLAASMNEMQVNWAFMTPSLLRTMVPSDLEKPMTIVIGGEVADGELIRQWSTKTKLLNGYGPSECCICCSVNYIQDPLENPQIVGKPLQSASIWIVHPDNHHLLTPPGSIGELVVQGHTLAKGYLDNDVLTASAFPERLAWDSLNSVQRVYKTGDLGRYLSDGRIEFIGRKGTELKIHGQRIDTNIIESCLSRNLPSGTSGAVETITQDAKQFLMAFVWPTMTVFEFTGQKSPLVPMSDSWRSQLLKLESKLSEALGPSLSPKLYIPLAYMPITGSKKLDRKALRYLAASLSQSDKEGYLIRNSLRQVACNSNEVMLQTLWAKILRIDSSNIGIYDNFFHLGGDSIAAIKLVAEARRAKFELTIEDIFEEPELYKMAARLEISDTQNTSMKRKHPVPTEEVCEKWNLNPECIENIYSCTSFQRSIISHSARDNDANALQRVFHLGQEVNTALFRSSWETVVAMSPTLRARMVVNEKGHVVQVILREPINWETADDLQEYLERNSRRKFGLGTSLIHFALIPDMARGHFFVLTVHHAIYDAWSDYKVLQLVRQCYYGCIIPEMPKFENFVEYCDSVWGNNASFFWESYLRDFEGYTFPFHPNSDYFPVVDKAFKCDINWTGQTEPSIRSATLIRGAWALVIGLFTNSQDVVLGSVQSGRTAAVPGISEMIGPTVTIVPVRQRWKDTQTVRQYLADLQAEITHMIPFEHCDIQLIKELSDECHRACSFQTILLVQPEMEAFSDVPFAEEVCRSDTERPGYAICFECAISSQKLSVTVSYDSSIINEKEVRRLVTQFEHMLAQMQSSMSESIGKLNLLTSGDLEWLKALTQEASVFIGDCVHWAIERQMRLRPNDVALCLRDGSEMTYRELDTLTLSLASHLQSLGVVPESVVLFCCDKSFWAVVSVVATLRAGGASAALDPSHPPDRLRKIAQETAADIVLTTSSFVSKFDTTTQKVICVDYDLFHILDNSLEISRIADPHNAAFIVFTSGSTGTPKGTILEHASVCATARANGSVLGLSSNSRVAQFASFSFDVYIEEICITLMYGACVCIVSDHDRLNDLTGAMKDMRVDWADLTPTVARTLTRESVPCLKTLVLGGETLTEDIIDQWADTAHIYNTYGPSECTIISTATSTLNPKSAGKNIGQPVGCVVWIVSERNHQQLLPLGCVGELLIEGPNVGRRFLKGDTNKSFIKSPHWPSDLIVGRQVRCYKTSDLGKYNLDGTLEFVGRHDSQVKFHGQRIELGEIEYHISAVFPYKKVVVEMINPAFRSTQQIILCLFEVSVENPPPRKVSTSLELMPTSKVIRTEINILKSYLKRVVPLYMVPTAFVPLTHLPTTLSGKIDRKSIRSFATHLPEQVLREYSLFNDVKRVPRNQTEQTLQALWADILEIPCHYISIDDSFFQLGGGSISAMGLVGAARQARIKITVADIFRYPVLSDLALKCGVDESQLIEVDYKPDIELRQHISRYWKLNPENIEAVYRCTPLQEDMIALTNLVPEANTLHQVFKLGKNSDIARLWSAWDRLAKIHDILRTRIIFLPGHSRPLQVVVNETIQCDFADDLEEYFAKVKRAPFNYGTPLVRFGLINAASNTTSPHTFIWTSHHATYDGWSIPTDGTVAKFKNLVHFIESMKVDDYGEFWKSKLAGFQASRSIFPRLSRQGYQPLTDSEASLTILNTPQPEGDVTSSTVLRCAWALVLGRRLSSRDVVFGIIQTGRGAPVLGISEIIGPAITLAPLRIRWHATETVSEFLYNTQVEGAEMLPFEHVGLTRIAELGNDSSCADACAFQSLLIIQPEDQQAPGEISGISEVPMTEHDILAFCISIECTFGKFGEVLLHSRFDSSVLSFDEVSSLMREFGEMIRLLGREHKDLMVTEACNLELPNFCDAR
ncbi:NRPS cluster protein [Microsporum audouinii]